MEIIVESSNRNKAKPTIGEIIEKFFNTKILGMSPDLYRAIKNSTIRRDCVQLSSKEKHLLELSYGFLKDKTNDNQASLSDIFEENCRCRCLILDKYDYFPTEKRLNKIIDRLSDDDVIKILFQGDKYIDCYSQYINLKVR